MNKISLKKVVRLGEYITDDPAWGSAYLTFDSITAKDFNLLQNIEGKADADVLKSALELLSNKFVEGKLPSDSGELQKIVKGDFIEMPIDVLIACIKSLQKQFEALKNNF